jgi:hypothetical protein
MFLQLMLIPVGVLVATIVVVGVRGRRLSPEQIVQRLEAVNEDLPEGGGGGVGWRGAV